MDMRQAQVPLIPEKLSTEQASRKLKENGKTGPIIADLHMIDPVNLFIRFLAYNVSKNMHKGLAHFVDMPIELFHSNSWATSARTTSGEFAHIIDAEGYEVDMVLPLEFALYCCTLENCGCQVATADEPLMARYWAHSYSVGRDHRDAHCTDDKGGIALQIQEACMTAARRLDTLLPAHPFLAMDVEARPQQDENELILMSEFTWIPQE